MKTRTIILLLLLGLSISPLMIGSIFSSTVTNETVSKGVFQNLNSIGSLKEDQINSIISQNTERLNLITSRTQLRLSLENYSFNTSKNDQEQMNAILYDARNSITSFLDIFVINKTGTVVASTNSSWISENYSNSNLFLSSQTSNHVDNFFLTKNNELQEYLSGPLLLNGSFLGVLVVISDAKSFLNVTENYTGLGKTGEIILLKKVNNNQAIFITPTRFDKYAALNRTISMDYCSCLFSLAKNDTLISNVKDYRNISVLLVSRYIRNTDWTLIVKIDRSEAFQNVTFLENFLLFLNIFMIIIIIIISFIVSSFISKPIIKISDAALKYSKGDLKYRVKTKSTDEMRLLSDAMNEMAQNLEQAREHLEQTMVQLHHSQKMEALGRLAGGVAHDFNNILTIILGYSQLAEEKLGKDNELKFELTQIREASLKAKLITRNLLVLSKRYERTLEAIDLNMIIREFSKTLKPLTPEYINIKLELPLESCLINGDKNQIEQILLNLFLNSKESIDSKGTIIFSLKKYEAEYTTAYGLHTLEPGLYVEFLISDTGVGINKENLEKIFEPFWSTKENGSGLGLSIIHSIVEQNHGYIKIASTINKGTEVGIVFPSIENTGNIIIPVKKKKNESLSSQSRSNTKNTIQTILVLDDEESIRELIDIILIKEGFTTIKAENALEAEKIFLENKIDLVITDIVMPGMNGLELAERLNKINPTIPIIFITGYDKYLTYDEVKEKRKILEKPFKAEDLLRMVNELNEQE